MIRYFSPGVTWLDGYPNPLICGLLPNKYNAKNEQKLLRPSQISDLKYFRVYQ